MSIRQRRCASAPGFAAASGLVLALALSTGYVSRASDAPPDDTSEGLPAVALRTAAIDVRPATLLAAGVRPEDVDGVVQKTSTMNGEDLDRTLELYGELRQAKELLASVTERARRLGLTQQVRRDTEAAQEAVERASAALAAQRAAALESIGLRTVFGDGSPDDSAAPRTHATTTTPGGDTTHRDAVRGAFVDALLRRRS